MSTAARKEPVTARDGVPVKPPVVPPLHNGDRLTREEFERRYDAMPNLKKAELLEGVVYIMSSPVSHAFHGSPHFSLNGWLFLYKAATPGVDGGDNSSLRLDNENEPQPDVFLRILPEYGGQSQTSSDGYVEKAPELAVEVTGSRVAIDLGTKLRVYARTGVKEYIVWRTYDRAIDWFVLRKGAYEPVRLPRDGVQRSTVFPGLWLNVPAILAGDLTTVIKTVEAGTRSSEHTAFVKQLGMRHREEKQKE